MNAMGTTCLLSRASNVTYWTIDSPRPIQPNLNHILTHRWKCFSSKKGVSKGMSLYAHPLNDRAKFRVSPFRSTVYWIPSVSLNSLQSRTCKGIPLTRFIAIWLGAIGCDVSHFWVIALIYTRHSHFHVYYPPLSGTIQPITVQHVVANSRMLHC